MLSTLPKLRRVAARQLLGVRNVTSNGFGRSRTGGKRKAPGILDINCHRYSTPVTLSISLQPPSHEGEITTWHSRNPYIEQITVSGLASAGFVRRNRIPLRNSP